MNIKILPMLALALSAAGSLFAQEDTSEDKASIVSIEVRETIDSAKKDRRNTAITLDGNGIRVTNPQSNRRFEFGFFMMDLGLNTLIDKTSYTPMTADLAANFQDVPAGSINKDLFSLNNGRSWTFNVYPVAVNYKAVNGKRFGLGIYSALGLQIYNFRWENNISFINNGSNTKIIIDSIAFSKNKLSLQYLSVPLMLDFRHKVDKNLWLVYGIGARAGYRLSSWTKQVSGERGKDKNHDGFNFRDYNFALEGELGLDDYFRFFVSYQLTNVYNDGALKQYPLSSGLRIGGF